MDKEEFERHRDEIHLIEKQVRLEGKVVALERDLVDLKSKFLEYVTKHEFTPVKLVVFGLVGTILTSALALILTRVLIPLAAPVG